MNALAALALGDAVGLDKNIMLAVLENYQGLEHRCEFVAQVQGVRWINDSKGTNVGANAGSISGVIAEHHWKSTCYFRGGKAKALIFAVTPCF